MSLKISDALALPLELVTESVGILAVKRAGKSHTAKKIVEQLHYAKQQVVVVDPKGDWWGLRSSADGKGPGIPIVIIGGEHGDVPLEPGSGELVAKMVVEQRVSVLLDLAELRKHQVATFMTAFLETLYRLKAKELYRTPMMLVIDEADAIAPQRPQKGEERMLGAAEDIVRRGGQRGIGIILVSQRAAVLNKNVLTQVGVLILLRTTGSQDIDAVDEWIKKHGQQEKREKVMASIAALPRGAAWVWAPGWPDERGIFRQVVVSLCDTFDSGATPKPGERRVVPKTVADVDLVAFRKEMAATIEKAKAEDPRELRRRIAELEREARNKAGNKITTVRPKTVEVPALSAKLVTRLEATIRKADVSIERLGKVKAGVQEAINDIVAAAKAIGDELKVLRVGKPDPRYERTVLQPAARLIGAIEQRQGARRSASKPPAEGLTGPQQAILDTVAMLDVRGIRPERDTVARWLGIHPNGGSYGTNLGYLRAEGYLETFLLTAKGQAAAREQDTGLEAALAALDVEPKRNIIRVLIDAGRPLSREELAEKLGIHPKGGSYGTNLGWLRTMGIITDRGPITTTEGLVR
jgi:hypothetical protein